MLFSKVADCQQVFETLATSSSREKVVMYGNTHTCSDNIVSLMQRIEALLGETVCVNGEESLWDDVLLCRVVNKLHPGLITTIHQPEGGEVQIQLCTGTYVVI